MAWIAYLALLAVWPVFLPAALARPHPGRRAARIGATFGLAATLYEIWMSFVWGPSVVNPIRVDVLVVIPLLVTVHLLTSRGLWRAGWRRSALAAGLVVLSATGTLGAWWAQTRAEMARHDAHRREANRLLFEAKFADLRAYDAAFDTPSAAVGELPFGHWTPAETATFTRIVVGGDGQIHLFFACAETECAYGPGAPLEMHADGWRATLVWRGVGERELALTRTSADALRLLVDGRSHDLSRTLPPLLDRPREERLAYLGAFSDSEPLRGHARVSQLWLWQGDEELLAVGIFRILVAGRSAEFVTPVVMGQGTHEGDAWHFTWADMEGPGEARVRLLDDGVELDLPRLGRRDPWPTRHLAPGALFRDEAIALASRGSVGDWQRWMDAVLDLHFVAGDVPPN